MLYSDLVIFIIGFGAGAAAASAYFRRKYERQYEEDIKSVRETLSDIKDKETKEPEKNKTDDISESKRTPTNYYDFGIKEKPYIISPNEFGEDEEYTLVTYIYYANKKLVNESDEIVANPENIIGRAALEKIEKSEEDALYIRNDRLKTDYEILKDLRNFEEK